MRIRHMWHQTRQLPNPRAYAQDPQRFVASARVYCLLIFAIGLLAALLGRYESGRRAAYEAFGFVEKVLKVVEAIPMDGNSRSDVGEQLDNAIRSAAPSPVMQMIGAMVGAGEVVELLMESPDERLATLIDPGNTCQPRVYQLKSANRIAIDVMVPAQIHGRVTTSVDSDSVFLVEFEQSCLSNIAAAEPFAVIEYDSDSYGVSFSARTYEMLGVEWLGDEQYMNWPENWLIVEIVKSHLTEEQIVGIGEFEKPYLNVLDVDMLKTMALDRANSIGDQRYTVGDLTQVFRTIYEYPSGGLQRRSVSWWIFSASARDAASAVPIAALAFSFLLLYSVRRIDPNGAGGNEPWIVIGPQSWMETFGALVWIALLFGSLALVTWNVWEYEGDAWGLVRSYWRIVVTLFPHEFFLYLGRTIEAIAVSRLFWLLVTNGVAGVLLVWATRYMVDLMALGHSGRLSRDGDGGGLGVE